MVQGRARTAVLVLSVLAVPTSVPAGAAFSLGGRTITAQETNFAGIRHATPGHRVVVQINHDTRGEATLDLGLVDEVFAALRTERRHDPHFVLESLPLVVIAHDKMRRFREGPQRLLFGRLESEVKRQQDVYPSPHAIFLTDAVLGDRTRLRAALHLGLGFLFDGDFHHAVTGLEHARPRPAD
jgi:hypothetical protein